MRDVLRTLLAPGSGSALRERLMATTGWSGRDGACGVTVSRPPRNEGVEP